MDKINVVARMAVRSLQTSARVRSVSMKEPISVPKGGHGGGHAADHGMPIPAGGGGVIPAAEGYQKVYRLQKEWSVPDGKMVWQKKPVDLVLYNSTIVLCALGVAYTLYLIEQMSFPKKPE